MEKKTILTLFLLVFSISLFAQSFIHRFEVNASFGAQQYRGDMGNDLFRYSSCMYGVGTLGVDFALNRSLGIKVSGMYGSYGYTPNTVEERIQAMNEILSSHMVTGVAALQYKFANGYLLKEDARFAPSLSAGIGLNKTIDFMKMGCVEEGTFVSFNGGANLRFNFNARLHAFYELRMGYFATDVVDKMLHGGGNDLYLQNAIGLGFNL